MVYQGYSKGIRLRRRFHASGMLVSRDCVVGFTHQRCWFHATASLVLKVLRVLRVRATAWLVLCIRDAGFTRLVACFIASKMFVCEKGIFFRKYLHILCFCSTFVAKILTMHIKIVMFSKVEVKVNVGPMFVLCKF